MCRQIPQSSMLRNVDWATHTCVISFETIGIWPEGADGTDVNNCARSGDGKLLATGDDFGRVKLFSHPACQPKVAVIKLSYVFTCIKSLNFCTLLICKLSARINCLDENIYTRYQNEIFDRFFFQSLYHSYGGHSSHVTNVSFLQDDSRLVSTGGADTSVLQWIVN